MASALSRVSAIAMEASRELRAARGAPRPGGEAAELRQLLDSRFEAEKLDAMKRLVNLMSRGRDCAEFFPAVVKNVASPSAEVRRLVRIFIQRYAEREPDIALLSVNSFQKDLTDKNPTMRATALRAMSSIKVPVIVPIVMLAIKKALTDLSPYVRKAAAAAVAKCHGLDSSQEESLVELLVQCLGDLSPIVVGTAVASFNSVCPDKMELLHKLYRRYCKMLLDVDEWGQLEMLDALHRYVRSNFSDPAAAATEDVDITLLLNSTAVLFLSRNPAVVLRAVALYTDLAPQAKWTKVVPPLLRLAKAEREQQFLALRAILSLAFRAPGLFSDRLRHFVVFPLENRPVRDLKLRIMVAAASEANVADVWRELQAYMRSPERELVLAAVKAVGDLAAKLPDMAEIFANGLMGLISKRNESLLPDILLTLRVLLQLKPSAPSIARLTKLLDLVSSPTAKTSILWLVGEYCALIPDVAPDVVRRCAKEFKELEGLENVGLKLQILTAACKVYVELARPEEGATAGKRLEGAAAGRMEAILRYLLEMARFDMDYDVRDRARFLRALVLEGEGTEALRRGARDVLIGKKKVGSRIDADAHLDFPLSTLSHLLGHAVRGYRPLPDWSASPTDPSVRTVEGDDPWTRTMAPSPVADRTSRMGSPVRPSSAVRNTPPPTVKVKKRVVNLDNWFDESASDDDAAEGAEQEGSGEESGEDNDAGGTGEEETEEESGEESGDEASSDEDDADAAKSLRSRQDAAQDGAEPIANLSATTARGPEETVDDTDEEDEAVPIRQGSKS
ncbi:adaptin N terminal region-domain-containing protein [Hyaloraphidium curvatum]|nr:adaptin N terminal region-domain-containing protein [Hyaloraphidium curvatum]